MRIRRVTMRQKKPILSLDFDGVCHSYESGWQGVDDIPDPPVEGLFEFLEEAKDEFNIAIYSSRSSDSDGIAAMAEWFAKHGGDEVLDWIYFPTEKPPASVGLDDRVLLFEGEWPDVGDLVDFESWVEES